MGLWDKIRGEFIDIIQLADDAPDTMVFRFERYGHEIKYGAKLVVREGQAAVFINEGKLADVFAPGTYTLTTQNLPILSTLAGWKYGFESPFKADVYYVWTRQFTDLKWGTKNPIMLRDAEFGPVRLRAFGTYVLRVTDPAAFIRQIVGTDRQFTTDEIAEQLRNMIVARFSDLLGESKIPILDLAANYDELSRFVTGRLAPEFAAYGLELAKLLVENISLPEAVEQAMDKRSAMGIVGNLSAYAQYEAATAMEAAAKNPAGMAAGGMGMGMGFAMANQMGQTMGQGGQAAAPPPVPQAVPGFFIVINGQQAGPFDPAALAQHVTAGRLTGQTLVWRQGMVQWTPAAQVPEMIRVLGAPPVPPPPPAGA